jgi:hypothetical protein
VALENLELWNKLGRTDPAHTKSFKRAGGFGGTAIKPIYTEQKMTEIFGPCGVGWGFSPPQFQVVPGSEGQVAVYCWLALWINHDGKVSAEIPGVGGDMVVVKQSNGLRTDDEAFKKAFTDAIGNAMKHLGMSADVHMGLFDDSKYVESQRLENAAPGAFTQAEPRAKGRDLYATVQADLRAAGNKGKAALRAYWTSEPFIEAYETFPENWQSELTAEKDAFLASYPKPTGGRVDPNASLDQQFKDTVGAA